MVVAAFLYRFQRQLERMNVRRHGNILSGFNGQPIGIDHRNFAVVEVHHFVRVFYDWRCVRRQEVFVLSYTDHQGTSLARGYELSGVVEGDYDDRVGTHYVVKGETRSEEHTSELQSRENLVCRLLLEKKKRIT